jgi:alcohol dehydrogenase
MPEPGENQVLIKIRASGMCYTDVHQTRGELPGDFPRTLGPRELGADEIVRDGKGLAAVGGAGRDPRHEQFR